LYNYSTYYTNCVLTRLVHQVHVYAFSVLTTRLHIWCTYKVLTNQGEVYQYIDHIVCFNIKDNHHHPKEHTILYIFCALGYNSLILLSWYKHWLINIYRSGDTHLLKRCLYSTLQRPYFSWRELKYFKFGRHLTLYLI
jgi:hypothetical protein